MESVFVERDLSKEERQKAYLLRQERRRRRQEDPSKTWGLYKGKVVDNEAIQRD